MKVMKFQAGGPAPAAAPGQAPEGGGQDPVQMLAEMAMQALQGQDCQMAMQVCEGFVALIQQAMGGGQPPVGQAPEGEPVFKKGGKMVGRKGCAKKQEGGEIYGKLKQNQKDKSQTFGDEAFSGVKGKKVKIKA